MNTIFKAFICLMLFATNNLNFAYASSLKEESTTPKSSLHTTLTPPSERAKQTWAWTDYVPSFKATVVAASAACAAYAYFKPEESCGYLSKLTPFLSETLLSYVPDAIRAFFRNICGAKN